MSDSVGKSSLCLRLSTSRCTTDNANDTDRVFVHALNTVKRIPRTGSARPPPSDRLQLYGLYKQSTEGNVEGISPRPTGNDPDTIAEREKWDAWHAHNGLSRTEAKRRYIFTLIETMHKYATTTPEARELVAELEFVWDQIKSNSVSSSSTSAGQLGKRGSNAGMDQSYTNPSQRISGEESTTAAGLRVLRPVSDGDEDDDEDAEFEDAVRHPTAGEEDEDDEALAIAGTNQIRDPDLRNRKWRRRIERTLVKMTAEIAALREVVDAARTGDSRRRNGVRAWFNWLIWVGCRHVLVDLALLGLLAVWAKRKGDYRVEQGLALLWGYIREKIRRIRIPGLKRGER